ncbi:MAG: sigma-54-dependent Fis family transcriptional regulator [Bacteroidota bacterium]
MNKTTKLNAQTTSEIQALLHNILLGTAGHLGKEFFENMVVFLVNAIGASRGIVTECVNEEKTRLRTLAYVVNEEIQENVEYDTTGTPCKVIMESRQALYVPYNTEREYPAKKDIESYVGIPILSLQEEILGHIAVYHEDHFGFSDEKINVLKIFAARCTAEIERLEAERKLKRALAENEALKNSLKLENSYLRSEVSQKNIYTQSGTKSKSLQNSLSLVEKVAKTKSTVLLTGETGTGKGVFANTIHELSPRKNHVMVKLNCATLPRELIESELFGHEKGSFTGAAELKIGKFELAERGTIFLDEIGELPLEQQSKLLRVLQDKEFDRVGGRSPVKADVRIIAATNKNLEQEVEKGNFRKDLFYRLNVFPIHLPPLRERKEDMPHLIDFFVAKHFFENQKDVPAFDIECIKMMQAYDWPGNIRELENVIERTIILCDGNRLKLDKSLIKSPANKITRNKPSLEELEKDYILDVLQKVNYKISGSNSASEILKINPNTLYSKMKKLGIR